MSEQDAKSCCMKDRITCAGLTPLGVLVTRLEVGLAALFLWAAFNKLRGPNGPQLFSDSIKAFKLHLPEALLRLSTGAVPWVEAVAGVLLLLGIWRRAAAAVFAALLVVFIVLIVQALARNLDVACGCFGKLSPFCPEKVGMCNIVQNTVMLAAAVLIMVTPRARMVRVA